MVSLVQQDWADQHDIARAFCCSVRSVRRYQRQFEADGVARELVRRLKGHQGQTRRPVNPLAARATVLAALAAVDWVVPFSEDTPQRLICRVGPDVLVKGGDYRPEDIAGGECVIAAGGEVKILAFVPGHSTSGMIETIKKG